MKLSNISISWKVVLCFATLVLISGVASAVMLVALDRIQGAVRATEASGEATLRFDGMSKTMIDLSGQVRGFLLTQDEDFAKGVAADYASVKKELAALSDLLPAPEEQRVLGELAKGVEGYVSEAGDPEVLYARDPSTIEKALEIIKSGANKKWMNAFKAAEADFLKLEAAARDASDAKREVTVFQSQLSIYGAGGIIWALAVGFGWLLHRQVSKPIVAIARVMHDLAAGDVNVEVPGKERRDEIGEMASAVVVFKANAIERVRAEQEAVAQRAAADTQREQSAAERARAAEEQAEVVRRLGAGLKNLADGDLTARLDGVAPAYAQIRDDFHEAIDKLKVTILTVISSAGAIEAGASEISAASDDLSRRSEQQAASLEETAATLNEVTATVHKSADGASHAREVVAAADADAKKSAVVVRQAVDAMGAIAKSSHEISEIIGVIDEIAFQTNLLALNAGVEAARAGDAGKGFAVVASEVRALAQRSADAAKQINGLISESTTQVESGVKLVAETGRSLERIMGQVADINIVVADIAAGSKEQSTALQQINTAIEQMNLVTQQNAAMVEQSTAAGRSLTQETSKLTTLIGQFRVGRQAIEAPARRDLPKAAPRALRAPAKPSPASKPKRVAAGGSASAEVGWEQF